MDYYECILTLELVVKLMTKENLGLRFIVITDDDGGMITLVESVQYL